MREERKAAGPRSIGDLITELMRATAAPRRKEMLELSDAWRRAAGPDVARRSRPLSLGKGGQLTVTFDSSALRQEVQAFRKEEILARMKEAFPARRIATLRCVIGE